MNVEYGDLRILKIADQEGTDPEIAFRDNCLVVLQVCVTSMGYKHVPSTIVFTYIPNISLSLSQILICTTSTRCEERSAECILGLQAAMKRGKRKGSCY